MKNLGSAQLINDRCREMQRSKHGSRQHPGAVQQRALGLSCSLRQYWEGVGSGAEVDKDVGNSVLNGSDGRADGRVLPKDHLLGKRRFVFWVSV